MRRRWFFVRTAQQQQQHHSSSVPGILLIVYHDTSCCAIRAIYFSKNTDTDAERQRYKDSAGDTESHTRMTSSDDDGDDEVYARQEMPRACPSVFARAGGEEMDVYVVLYADK